MYVNHTKSIPNSETPWILVGISFLSLALCLYLWINQKFIQYPVNPLYFLIGASLLLATKHKVAWTVSSSWIVVSFFLIALFSFRSGFEFQAFHFKLILSALACSLLIQLFFIGVYFKSPYLNQRSNLLGTDSRLEAGFDGFMETRSNKWPVKISNISTTGLLVNTTAEIVAILRAEKLNAVKITIPALSDFQSQAEIKRLNENSIGMRFSGWSLSSLGEHFKLVKHIRQVNKVPKPPQSGFSLVEMMVVVGLSSFVVFLTLTSLSQLDRATTQSQLDYEYAQLKSELSWTLRDRASWENTKKYKLNPTDVNYVNTALNCLKIVRPDGTIEREASLCDSTAALGNLQILNAQNQVVIDSANLNAGFTRSGTPCNTFDAANGNDQCPLRFVAIPRFVCNGTCLNPTIEVTLQATFKARTNGLMLNTSSGVVVVYKDPVVDSIAETCTSIGGNLDANGFCRLDVMQANCNAVGEVLIGMNNGVPVCGNPYGTGQTCPSGSFITGFDINGVAQCVSAAGVATATTVPPSGTWQVSVTNPGSVTRPEWQAFFGGWDSATVNLPAFNSLPECSALGVSEGQACSLGSACSAAQIIPFGSITQTFYFGMICL